MIFLIYLTIAFFIGKKEHNEVRNTLRMSSWNAPGSPNAFIKLEIDVTEADKFLKEENSKNSGKKKLTYTHVGLKSIANGMKKRPDDFGKIIFGK